MNTFIIHYTSEGRIIHALTPATEEYIEAANKRGDTFAIFEGDYPNDILSNYWYNIEQGEYLRREDAPFELSGADFKADGVDSITLSGLPNPCVVMVDDEEYTITDGQLVLDSEVPAQYHLRINHWPYKDWYRVVEAIP